MARVAHAMATLLLAASLAGAVRAAGPHQHGVASLELVVEGSSLSVSLDSPLDNLLGIERAPRSAAERAAARSLAQRLRSGATLVRPTAAAGCRLQALDLVSDVIPPELLAAAPAAASPAAASAPAATTGHAGHADLQVGLRFQCSQPQALKSVDLGGLFQAFPRLRQIDAALVAPGVQRGARLRPQQSTLAW